jgi:UDP-N-acetylmuramoylalanine-D-glutamate ligase
MKFSILTFGCKVNSYESEFMKEQLLKNDYIYNDDYKSSDIVIVNTCSVTNLVGLPETGHMIIDTLKNSGCNKNMLCADDMVHAVKLCSEVTEKGKACLFSPAAASYNYYKNFEEKGKHYKSQVQSLTK